MPVHYNIWVKGKVQGVFYRVSAEKKARELGLSGFVQNLPAGEVYAEVEGEMSTLETFVKWCRIGPSKAEVIDVQVVEAEWKGFVDFSIKR
jgi:acylphosphatase